MSTASNNSTSTTAATYWVTTVHQARGQGPRISPKTYDPIKIRKLSVMSSKLVSGFSHNQWSSLNLNPGPC